MTVEENKEISSGKDEKDDFIVENVEEIKGEEKKDVLDEEGDGNVCDEELEVDQEENRVDLGREVLVESGEGNIILDDEEIDEKSDKIDEGEFVNKGNKSLVKPKMIVHSLDMKEGRNNEKNKDAQEVVGNNQVDDDEAKKSKIINNQENKITQKKAVDEEVLRSDSGVNIDTKKDFKDKDVKGESEVKRAKQTLRIKKNRQPKNSPKVIIKEKIIYRIKEVDEEQIFLKKLKELSILGVKKRQDNRIKNLAKILANYDLLAKIQVHDVQKLLNVSRRTAINYLAFLAKKGKVIRFDTGVKTFYRKV